MASAETVVMIVRSMEFVFMRNMMEDRDRTSRTFRYPFRCLRITLNTKLTDPL